MSGTAHPTKFGAVDISDSVTSPVQPPFSDILRPWWMTHTTSTIMVEATLYAVYLGYTLEDITVANVSMHVVGLGAGTQTAEIGLASSPAAPNGSSQTLTKLVATGSLDTLTSGTGIKGAASALNHAVPAGTHLWACVRTAMSSTEPSSLFVIGDLGRGYVLTLASASALTGLTSWTGSVPALSNGGVGPLLFATLA